MEPSEEVEDVEMTTIRVTMSQHEEMSVVTKETTAPMVEVTTSIAPSEVLDDDTVEEMTTAAAPVNVLDKATTKNVTEAQPKSISVMDILVPATTPKQDDRKGKFSIKKCFKKFMITSYAQFFSTNKKNCPW